ncbi:MAG: glycosyltransferase family 2 protein [Methanobacteriaceae archaeon]|nr:glycosyltransferase family 2 protein [Candidatus Methanorudis spinitermitis]
MLSIERETTENDDFDRIIDTDLESTDKQFEIEDLEDKKGIFLIIPAYNEEKTVGEILEHVSKLNYKIVLVDDGSKDNTYKIAKKSRDKYPENIFIYRHILNRGLGAALKTGMNCALKHNAKFVVTFDADGQHDVEDIAKVCKPLIDGEAEVVIGARPFEDMPKSKSFANNVMNFLTLIFYKTRVKDSQSGLRAFKADVISDLNIVSQGYGVSSEFIREIRKNSLKLEEVTITTIYTPETQAKGTNIFVGIKILLKMIFDIIK